MGLSNGVLNFVIIQPSLTLGFINKIGIMPEEEGKLIGKITHYYSNIGVAIIELDGDLSVGDKIKIKGGTTDFEQEVDSMEVEHQKVQEAKKGDSIGLKVNEKMREGSLVYKL